MNVADLVADLQTRGIRLGVAGDRLRWVGPLTKADRDWILRLKPELLSYLAQSARQDGQEGGLEGTRGLMPAAPVQHASPGSSSGLTDRQQAAAEALRGLVASGSLEREQRRVTLEFPGGARVRILPEGVPADRPGLLTLTWAELGRDPLDTLRQVTTIFGALVELDGRLVNGGDR